MLYLISYDLREAVPDHDYLNSRLEEMGAIRVLPSQWLLVSDLDVRAILNLVVESGTMNRTDGLFIVQQRRDAYWDALLIDNPSVHRLFQELY